jgi:hypothetical protein
MSAERENSKISFEVDAGLGGEDFSEEFLPGEGQKLQHFAYLLTTAKLLELCFKDGKEPLRTETDWSGTVYERALSKDEPYRMREAAFNLFTEFREKKLLSLFAVGILNEIRGEGLTKA